MNGEIGERRNWTLRNESGLKQRWRITVGLFWNCYKLCGRVWTSHNQDIGKSFFNSKIKSSAACLIIVIMSNVDLNAPVNQSETANELGKKTVNLTVKALEEKILSHQKEKNLRIKKLYKLRKEVEQLMLSKENVSRGTNYMILF